MTLQSTLEQILALYPSSGARDAAIYKGTQSEVVKLFDEGVSLIKAASPYTSRLGPLGLRVNKPSRWGYWPWIAVLSNQESETTQFGTYVAYLFSAAGDTLYLALAQGASFGSAAAHELDRTQYQAKQKKLAVIPDGPPSFNMDDLKKRSEEYRANLPAATQLLNDGWVRGDQMKLSAPPGETTQAAIGAKATGRQYEASTIVAREYEAGSLPGDADLLADLDKAMGLYEEFLMSGISHTHDSVESAPPPPPATKTLALVRQAYEGQGLRYSDVVIASFLTSLQTKGFVILSGLSGTGKTRIAQALGRFVHNPDVGNEPRFLSVRPDWRDSKPLIGYRNPILKEDPYQSTPFIEHVKRAAADFESEHPSPWLVILDEMNLARVEYYFADLLSVLESGRDSEGWTVGSVDADVPTKLPPNLFFVGTVNVDETTHAFSPKVLDRAFTLEVGDVDFEGYPEGLKEPASVSEEVRSKVTELLSRGGEWAQIAKAEVAECVAQHDFLRPHLIALNGALAPFLLNFGYRVFDEIAEFTYLAATNGLFGESEDVAAREAFDIAVLTKILPKFYGSRQRLEEPLRTLLAWCVYPEDPSTALITDDGVPVHYARTHARATRMLRELERDGFASFG